MDKMDKGLDFLELIGPDAAKCVFNYLDDSADLACASAVSKSWRQFAIENGLSKNLCKRLCPDVSHFTGVSDRPIFPSARVLEESSSAPKSSMELLEHKVYTYLNQKLVSSIGKKDQIHGCIGASTTDHFPEERIQNTLEARDRTEYRSSYWSSKGEFDSNVDEFLMYYLNSPVCIVDEIKIQPFEAYFQIGYPIYASRSVRFKFGYHAGPDVDESTITEEDYFTNENNYVWTYISPEYPMQQENVLQCFKLPRPVLCIGCALRIELLGRVQKQATNDLYYICINHVQVIGKALASVLRVDWALSDIANGKFVFHYNPKSQKEEFEKRLRHHENSKNKRFRHDDNLKLILGQDYAPWINDLDKSI